MRRLSIAAPAKINLFLDLLARRPDGYHDLCTLFAEVGLADRLTLQPADEGRLRVVGPYDDGVPADERNLVWKAMDLMQAEPSVGICLEKNVPHGAGLGGGSADAAAALVLLNALRTQPLPPAELEALASKLGSDCTFFVRTGPAMGTDRGTRLEPVTLARPVPSLLVLPEFPISTREAYGRITPAMLGPRSDAAAWIHWCADPTGPPPQGANTFEEALFPAFPELAAILADLRGAGAIYARLSGSGSACFGLFASNIARDAAARALASRRVVATEVLPRWPALPDEVARSRRTA